MAKHRMAGRKGQTMKKNEGHKRYDVRAVQVNCAAPGRENEDVTDAPRNGTSVLPDAETTAGISKAT